MGKSTEDANYALSSYISSTKQKYTSLSIFDTISHVKFLEKIKSYGLGGKVF